MSYSQWYLITCILQHLTYFIVEKETLFSVCIPQQSCRLLGYIYISPRNIYLDQAWQWKYKKGASQSHYLKNFPVEKMRQKCTLMYSFRTTNTCNILCVLLLHQKSQTIWQKILIILKARTEHLMQSCKMSYSQEMLIESLLDVMMEFDRYTEGL